MNGFELLERRMRGTAIDHFTTAGATVLLGLFLLVGSIAQSMNVGVDAKLVILGLGGVGALALSSRFVGQGRALWPARSAKLYRALEGEAKGVAWVYRSIGNATGLVIGLVNGDLIELVATMSDSQTLLAFVSERAPHALVGYTEEQKKLYEEVVKAHRG
jgi:hypothetical protein